MTDSEIITAIAELLTEAGSAAHISVLTAHTSLTEGGLELSSLELVRLLVGLESRLGIQVDDEEVMNATFGTVEDIVRLVRDALVPTHAG